MNNITTKVNYPIPMVVELLDELGDAQFFTNLDLCTKFEYRKMTSRKLLSKT